MLIEALAPLHLLLPEKEVFLVPGQRMTLSDEYGHRLLEKVGTKARLVSVGGDDNIVVELASTTAKEVFWERADGQIYGPSKPEFLACVGKGAEARFWVVLGFDGVISWVRSDRLRSRRRST